MDRQNFIRTYGIRGHSTKFVTLVYLGVAFFVLPQSADVPDEWWQSLEIAYQQLYVGTLANESYDDEFPDGAFFENVSVIPLESRTFSGPMATTLPQRRPTLPVNRQLAYGVRPWEWQPQNQLRSFSYPLFFYGMFSALKSVEDALLRMERNALAAKLVNENLAQPSTASASPLNFLTSFTAQLLSTLLPNPIGWIKTLFYALPKVFCVAIAILLHKACCRLGALVFEEILLSLPYVKKNEAPKATATTNKKKDESAKRVYFKNEVLSDVLDLAGAKGAEVWSEDVLALRSAIAPTTPDKFNKRVSIFVLTNFMVLYMSSRSLSNVPEALVFMWCLVIYAGWRVRNLHRQQLLGTRNSLLAQFAPSQSSTLKGAPNDVLKTAVCLLIIGGFGCTLRTTMAVPFAGIFFSFVMDILMATNSNLVKNITNLLRVVVVSVLITAMWLAIVLALDSWYYCDSPPLSTLTTLASNPLTIVRELMVSDSDDGNQKEALVCKYSFTPLNFYRFNFQQGSSSFFGSHPWYWYFAMGAPACIGANCTILLLWVLLKLNGRLSPRSSKSDGSVDTTGHLNKRLVSYSPLIRRIGLIILSSLAVYSVLEHKEMRFVFPFISGPVMVICAVLYEECNNCFYVSEASKTSQDKNAAASNKKGAGDPEPTGPKASTHQEKDAKPQITPRVQKTMVQRLALICLMVNVVGLLVIGRTFKVGPPSLAAYFRSSDFNFEKLKSAREVALGINRDSKKALQIDAGKSYLPSLHVWAGCYTMPGPSHYHHVFRSIRSVSCNTMATTKKQMVTRRLATEHELFLQFPIEFLNYTYGTQIVAAKENNKLKAEDESSSSTYIKRQRKVIGLPNEEKKSSSKKSSTLPDDGTSFISTILKSLQSKAAQDTPLDSGEGGSKTKTNKEERQKIFNEKIDEALVAIQRAGQILSSNSTSLLPKQPYYGGLLGYQGSNEPLPDAIIMFSSLSAEIEDSMLGPLGYTLTKRFYHTFAVVDEGTSHFVELWMRQEL